MYVLALAVIAITLIIIAVCVSYDIIPPTILQSYELIDVKPVILQQTCSQIPTKKSETILGMYNISVRKVYDGYTGLIRGCTWNGCSHINESPSFSYPYRIKLESNGTVSELERIELDYNNLDNCKRKFRNVYANGIEDPKLFMFQGEEWAIANCLGSNNQTHPCINTICIFKVLNAKETFRLLKCQKNVDDMQVQKNWSPFEWNGKLLCEYSINPHIILEIDVDNGTTSELYNTSLIMGDKGYIPGIKNNISSEGSFRGAPAILVESATGPIYLGIGHMRVSRSTGYLHFFYIFEARPPFSITAISKLFKLDKSETIQFAAGLSQLNNNIYVSYGINDCSNRIAQYDINDIFGLFDK